MREIDGGGDDAEARSAFFFLSISLNLNQLFFSFPLSSTNQSDPFAWGLCVAAPAAALFAGDRGGAGAGSNGLAAFAAASGNPFLSAAQCSAAVASASATAVDAASGVCSTTTLSSVSAAAASGAGAGDKAASAVPVAKAGDDSSPGNGGDDGHRFRFSAGAAMLPHPEKVARGGEDAFFVSEDGLTLGEK